MARIKYETATAFANRMPHRDSSSFYSTGDAIFSYDMRLAHWQGDKIVLDYPGRGKDGYKPPSATTNLHMIALERVLYNNYLM